MSIWIKPFLLSMLYLFGSVVVAASSLETQLASDLTASSFNKRLQAIESLGSSDTKQALLILNALAQGTVYVTPEGQVLLEGAAQQITDVLNGSLVAALPSSAQRVSMNNRLRGVVRSALAYANLFDSDQAIRLQAARELPSSYDPRREATLRRALGSETNDQIKTELKIVLAKASLASPDINEQLNAIKQLGDSGQGQYRKYLENFLDKKSDGTFNSSLIVREAAKTAIAQIEKQQTIEKWLGNVFFGLSLGSVLLLAALGLAIIFGLMGVINMAHGELLMIGAYSTYLVQNFMQRWFPDSIDLYVLVAIPVAFVMTALVGMAIEKTVIRWLYGRPLETLLATWGVSLILMQTVRSIFGAQNVALVNPSWMSGGWQVTGDLIVSYNRIYIFFFALFVVGLIWVILNQTRIGLFVRAITQNRRMANCVGVSTDRVDMLAFGLGAGVAGLGGVALSQLGNVGPDLGKSYIVDSFMVVVLGGVGQLAGTVVAALGLGAINKSIEPVAGAVIAKIVVLMIVILFIQQRPRGIFAPKGRSAE